MIKSRGVLFLILAMVPGLLLAHPQHSHGGGFLSGLLHPVSGFDHLLAFFVIGVWAVVAKIRIAYLLIGLTGFMLVGMALPVSALLTAVMQWLVIASAIAFGGLLLVNRGLSSVTVSLAAGIFVSSHGYMHKLQSSFPVITLEFISGLLLASIVLLLLGVAFAALLKSGKHKANFLFRLTGLLVATLGLTLGTSFG